MEHNNVNFDLERYIDSYYYNIGLGIENREMVKEFVNHLLESNYYEHSLHSDLYDDGEFENILTISNNLRSFLINNESLFHYTSFNTALKILNSNRLKFNNVTNQIDPNEYIKGNLSTWFASGTDIETVDRDRNKFAERNESRVMHHQCISFSSNTQIVNYINVTKLQYILNLVNKEFKLQDISFSHYHIQSGFDKSRMWENYSDNYAGVCLMFDINKITTKAIERNIKFGHINYLTNLKYVTFNKSKEESLMEQIDNTYFHKRLDYRDECEFRLLVNSPDEKFFDIKDSLVGVIYGPNSEAKLYQKIIKNSFQEFDLKHIRYEISGNNISNSFYEMI